ncbi:MAG: VWA domain-containing protein, partial [Candidatus Desantisbacteria bacterium]
FMKAVYDEEWPELTKKDYDKEGVPLNVQYGYGIIYYWLYGKDNPAIKNPKVKEALEKTRQDVTRAYNMLPGSIRITHLKGENKLRISTIQEGERIISIPEPAKGVNVNFTYLTSLSRTREGSLMITNIDGQRVIELPKEGETIQIQATSRPSLKEKKAAFTQMAQLVRSSILPVYEELVEESIKQRMKDGIPGKGGAAGKSTPTQGEAEKSVEDDSREIANRLGGKIPTTDEAKKEQREEIKERRRVHIKKAKVSKEPAKAAGAKEGELPEEIEEAEIIPASEGEAGEAEEIEITVDEIEGELPSGKEGEDKESKGKIRVPEKEGEEELPPEEGEGEGKESEEGLRPGEREPKPESGRRVISRRGVRQSEILWRRRELERRLQAKLTRYDNYYTRVVSLIERLFGILDNELHKDERFQYRGYYESGPKVDLRKAMVIGKTGDTKIWLKRERPTKISFKFVLVLDESGSMGDDIDNALSTIVMLQEVLSRLDIDFAVVGFSNSIEIHKTFGDKFKQQNKDVLISELKDAMDRGGSTAEGDGVAVALDLIEKEMSDERFIIVITDGDGNSGA